MTIRENIIASAVSFLQDPNVVASPIENRIAFLQSKNLTQEEIDEAMLRASGTGSPSNYQNATSQHQIVQPPTASYRNYQYSQWQAPPPIPTRDWRDWFIMATIMGGVGFGLLTVAKRYIIPLIAPPTPPQLEQDKKAIDESFEKAFSLLDQLSKDTELLKTSEEARTKRLDAALTEVESVTNDLKAASRRREDESRRITDEVQSFRNLIPKAIEEQRGKTDARLKEINAELKSLKLLMGQRINSANSNAFGRASSTGILTGASVDEVTSPEISEVKSTTPPANNVVSSMFNAGYGGKASIPSWQLAANRSASSTTQSGSVGGAIEQSSTTHDE
ncbi:microbody (peroxisome) biogenesis protein peroxin 14 [Blumeria hordei DH14]|uniref:Peroxisomal membrane protein PEX14 n=1 Tax=Blumeria graminis f. sp. hordei (strain DH14) TaxID=546991 RepID=N1J6I8_BLUG1|nr:microbody (peroxisome) biogenesis protein peroxin 14 [Blumeria hordei DH14]